MTCRRRWLTVLLTAGLLVVLYWARGVLLPPVAFWLDVGVRPQRADYVMVLGGGVDTRPFAAAALFKAGLAPRVLVSRVERRPASVAGTIMPEDEVVRRVLIARGVPAAAIRTHGQDLASTFDEAQSLRTILRGEPAAKVIIVTNEFHTRRTRWIFRQVLGHQGAQVCVVSAPTEGFSLPRWWQSEPGFTTIGSENLKLALYVMYYSRWGLIVVLLALAAVTAGAYRCRRASIAGQSRDAATPAEPQPAEFPELPHA